MTRIVRVFHATAKPGQEAAFRQFFLDEALPLVRGHEGLVSAQVGLPTEQAPREFLMVSTWRDLDALKGFAGADWNNAVIDPREAPLLERVEVFHYLDAAT